MFTLRTTSAVRVTYVLVLLAACLTSNDISVRTSEIDDHAPRDTGDDYDLQHVSVQGYIQQKPGFYAVRAPADWRSVWTENQQGTVPTLPSDVDLKAHMLFVATSKTPGAKAIEVQKITHTADGLHIYVTETLLPTSCAPVTNKAPPMDIVSFDNVPFNMHVVYDRIQAESCGPPPDPVVACRIAGSGAAGSDKITASPGEVIDCDSSQSRAQVGTIIDRSWQLNVVPPGSATKLTIGKANMGVSFPVDAWGVYQVGLGIRDATREGSGLGIIEVLPPNTGVELYFNRAANPEALQRVELHVVELPFSVGSSSDCSIQGQKSWCEVHTAVGLQQGELRPEGSKRYRVAVKYLDAHLPGSPIACVRAFAKGILPVSTCDAEDAQRGRNAVWDLGALDTPHATFYDARLPKPPVAAAASADAGAPNLVATIPTPPPPPPPRPTTTHPPPPPPPPPPPASTVIEL